jgi:8-oxo-dGTP pyrophosphatase MutT (NUDIX family)
VIERPTATWDGLPIAPEAPFGAMVVVVRRRDVLLLRRAAAPKDAAGDWVWTPPSGARQPGETIDACAIRELVEETGLAGRTPRLVSAADWAIYRVDVPDGVQIRLDAEHSEYRWVSVDEARVLCRPARVAEGVVLASEFTKA